MKLRIILSVIAAIIFGMVDKMYYYSSPIIASEASVGQLENSNQAYLKSQIIGGMFNGHHLGLWILLVALLIIWINPIMSAVKSKEPKEATNTQEEK